MRAERRIAIALLVALLAGAAGAAEWSGNVALEARLFAHAPPDGHQHGDSLSVSVEPEFFHDWDDGRQSLTITPFARYDGRDNERTHADLREAFYLYVGDRWELRLGFDKVFWGVTESAHLVDIINQTDAVENIDGEDKLGQPLIKLGLERDFGNLDFFVLPYFRERTLPGPRGRLRTQPVVDTDRPIYASGAREWHVDFALRWRRSFDAWDVGISHFHGTSREPRFVPALDRGGMPVLRPLYEIIDQTGVDIQFTHDAWLWKFEGIHRSGQGPGYFAAVGGFEYTRYGIFESAADLGLLAELHYDERRDQASTPFEHDLFVGARWAANDVQSTEALVGVIQDLGDGTRAWFVEASRRFGASWKLSVDARIFSDVDTRDPLFALRDEDHVRIELARYF
ncbi:MAG: hypothetical protein KDG50_05195 [Chromatiales bacterium]|nr:hypothetical protein [Chromatiales bacterium]